MSCPNSNKIFDNFLFNSGLIDKNLNPSEKAFQRRRVYYTICIMLRLFIFGLLLQLKDKVWLPYVVGIVALISSINLAFFRKEDNQWWSNTFSLIMNILLFVASILIIFKTGMSTLSIPLLFLISIFGGIFQSLIIQSC
jgi:uncharacterized membrane protein HdeD (DUF308 family)